MDRRERVLTTLNLEEPDRVPTHVIYLDANIVDKILGPPQKSDFETIAQMKIDFPDDWLDQLNDVILEIMTDVFTRMVQTVLGLGMDCAQIGFLTLEFINDHEITDIFGRVYEALNNEGNIYPYYKYGLIDSVEKWGQQKSIIEDQTKKYAKFSKSFYKRINKKFKDQSILFVTNDIQGIWESGWQGFGMNHFVRQMFKNRPLIESVFEVITDFTINCFMGYMDAGAEVFIESEDLAYKTGPMMSPKQFDEFLVPCYKRLTEAVHERGGKIILHSDGNITPLLDSIVESGFDGLHSLEPTAGVDLKFVKKKVGKKLCLLGNIDVGAILTHGTKSDVYKAVKTAIKSAAPGGGFILSASNMIKSVKIENLKHMVEATHEYGTYPINLE